MTERSGAGAMVDDGFLDEDVDLLSSRIRNGAISVETVIHACIARIASRDPRLHAFVEVFAETSMHRAQELDAELARGHWRGPLHGLPIAVKDIADIEGSITGFGSRCYSTAPATRNAAFIGSLTEAGAVIVGKTQMVEFAYGSWGTNHGLGTPVNPTVGGHASPGGSSSGSAVAVAGGMVPLAVGTDTGGSIRIPAALCGIAGLKPSHGLVPLDGVAPLSAALDAVGPMARSVSGLRLLLKGLQPDWQDTPLPALPATVWTLAAADLEPADPDILDAYHAAILALNAGGVDTPVFTLPRPLAEYQRLCGEIMAFDAFQTVGPLVMDHRLPIDPWVRRRIAQGQAITVDDHHAAEACRADDIARFRRKFGPDDMLFLPGTPFPPRQLAEIDETEVPMSRYTRIANYLDLCGVTLPLAQHGRAPFAMQLLARAGRDDFLLSAASPGALFGQSATPAAKG